MQSQANVPKEIREAINGVYQEVEVAVSRSEERQQRLRDMLAEVIRRGKGGDSLMMRDEKDAAYRLRQDIERELAIPLRVA